MRDRTADRRADRRSRARCEPGHWFESRPAVVQARRLLRDPHPRLLRRQRRRLRRLPRPDREARLPRSGSASTASGCCRCTRSPLRDGGYDIADFFAIHPDYGTVEDFRAFVEAAHQRGMRVIADLVMNHTSSRPPVVPGVARRARTGPKRDWYVWSDTDEPLPRRADHLHRHRAVELDVGPGRAASTTGTASSRHQPDLNYDNPEVQEAMLDVLRFWLDLGIDGFRLDAVPVPLRARGDERREPAARRTST